MFFPDRVTGIKPGDRVLEVGPGGTPHPRSDEYLDLDPSKFADEREAFYQRGSAAPLRTDKPVTYYDGRQFPFADSSFDYVICSHVLEHVDDVELFLAELFRVGDRGYIEFPTILYEYLYSIPVHVNLLTFREGHLMYLPKADTPLPDFEPVQRLLLRTFEAGHTRLVDDMQTLFFEGFEWDRPFPAAKAHSLEPFVPTPAELPLPTGIYPNPGSLPAAALVRLLVARAVRPARTALRARRGKRVRSSAARSGT